MEIVVEKIPTSSAKLIPIASERLNGVHPQLVTAIKNQDMVFEVFDFYKITQYDMYPTALMFAAFGADYKPDLVFKQYPKSNAIYLFVTKLKEDGKS
jgi:hypothetical protein